MQNSELTCVRKGIEADLKIYTLGRYQVFYKDSQLSIEHGRSRKIWDLLMYFISHSDKIVAPDAIVEALWPEQEYANLNSSVKNLVHRLRKHIETNYSKSCGPFIISANGCYGLNSNYSYWLDAEVFESICIEAKELANNDSAGACAKYCQAFSLYKGEYLPDCSNIEWVQPLRQYYRQLFINSMKHLVTLLKEQGNYAQIVDICEKALYVERFEENLHVCYMEALLEEDKAMQAFSHYNYITRLYYEELGVKPSVKMKHLYRIIRERCKQECYDHNDLEKMLQERDKTDGPLICELETFQTLCKLEKRRAERDDRPVHVGILSLESSNSNFSLPSIVAKLTGKLSVELYGIFRKGDVLTILNEAQIAVLLPGTSFEQAETILQRADKLFVKANYDDNIVVYSSVHPIIPFEYL